MKEIDFLKFGPAQIRHQIREIITSYSHTWDILAETIQNSSDAIKKARPTKGHINVLIDKSSNKIVVEDNGCGISSEDLPTLLAPFSSSKINDAESVGEKGVGITFVLFSSSSFEISTNDGTTASRYELEGASGWLSSNSVEMPKLKGLPADRDLRGTSVKLTLNKDHPLFKLSFAEIDYILRTRTAIGDTAHVFDLPEFNCDYSLLVKNEHGGIESKEGECRYLLPTDLLKPENYADIDLYEEWRNDADRSDAQKRNFWKDKAVVGKGAATKDGRQIRYWFFYTPRRTWWAELNKHAGLLSSEDDEDIYEEGQLGFSGGMQVSTKHVPTGISAELKPRGSAGYIPNFFFLVEDPKLKLDIGRKSIASPPLPTLTSIAYPQFRRVLNDVQKYTSGTPEIQSDFDRADVLDQIDQLPDLASSHTSFIKRPSGQEASIAAMFFECIGSKKLNGYKLITSGYKGKYDLFVKRGANTYIFEFKFDLKGLMKDFREETKLFEEIDVVVLWEVTEADRKEVKRRGLDLSPNSAPPGKTVRIPEATQKLSFSVGIVSDIFIIEMKKILEVD